MILRRGPSKWVQLILWYLETDTFEYGQWFRGRIYSQRCDLSPDGTKFVYFAQKINGQTIDDTEYTYAWTAISRPPYLTALALWPKGNSWNGGGLFLTNNALWLNHDKDRSKPHKDHKPKRLKVKASIDYKGEDETVFYKRLERDHWVKVADGVWPKITFPKWIATEPDIWRKYNRERSAYIEMKLTGYDSRRVGDSAIYLFSVYVEDRKSELPLTGVEWADWDYRGRLVFASKGSLFSADDITGYEKPKLISDFNSQGPYRMVAPDWACKW